MRGHPFPASWGGRPCEVCGERIREGDLLCYYDGDELIHDDCADEPCVCTRCCGPEDDFA